MGLDTVSYCLVMEELGRADSSVRGIVSVNNGLAGKTIAKWGTEEQKREWLPRLCSRRGARVLRADGARAAAPTPRRSSRARSATATTGCSTARRSSSRSARGRASRSCSRAPAARGRAASRASSCRPARTGFCARKIDGKLGLRAQDTAELFLDGVRVPDSARLGDEGAGFKVAMSALDNGRISLAAGSVGIAQGCVDASRRVRRRAAAVRQADRRVPARAGADRRHGRRDGSGAADRVARGLSRRHGQPYTLAASQAKYYASEVAVRAANAAVQVHGGYGYVDEFPVAKYLRDARVSTLYEGTSQIQKLLIGRALTGESAFV